RWRDGTRGWIPAAAPCRGPTRRSRAAGTRLRPPRRACSLPPSASRRAPRRTPPSRSPRRCAVSDRGFALVDALVATALMAVVCMAAADVLVALPSLAAGWDDAADARQRMRVVEARVAGVAAGAGPILVEAGGTVARVPSLWPRRLGLWRPD